MGDGTYLDGAALPAPAASHAYGSLPVVPSVPKCRLVNKLGPKPGGRLKGERCRNARILHIEIISIDSEIGYLVRINCAYAMG